MSAGGGNAESLQHSLNSSLTGVSPTLTKFTQPESRCNSSNNSIKMLSGPCCIILHMGWCLPMLHHEHEGHCILYDIKVYLLFIIKVNHMKGRRMRPHTRMPSNLAATKASPGSLVASAKIWCSTSSCPNFRLSWLKKPDSEPLPYWMANSVPFFCRT